MAAADLKKRNEELSAELQQCKFRIGKLEQQEESSRLQWEAMKDSHGALCQKYKEFVTEKKKLEAEKQKLEVENGLFIEKMMKMGELGNENADLQRKNIAMRKEKEDLWNELQAAKAERQLYKEDFDHEREDRAKAHAQIDDIRTKLTEQLEEARRELQLHQKRLSEVEAVNQRKEGEMRSALEEALASRQEVQAKASQVKQFKKQVDSLKQHVAEGEKQCKYLIQEMEKVRTELLKYKGKAEKAQMKKKVTDKVATSASSPVTPPPPGWESKVADLERENEDLRNENHRLIVENDEYLEEMQNLQKMCDTMKCLVDRDQQHVEQARVSSHGFTAGSRPDTVGAMVQSQPRPPPVVGYAQNQELIRQQLQQGFQQQPHTEQQTAGAGALAPSGPTSLSGAMYNQAPVPRAKIQPPEPKPRVSKSSEERAHQPSIQYVPYDPNLVCPFCNKQFRIGEIQKYKHHVETCNGSEAEEQVSKEDFDDERKDRAKDTQIDDIRAKLTEQLEEARRELQLHQKRLSEVEAVNQRKEGELRSALEEAQAEASQAKKQVHTLKTQQENLEADCVSLQQQLQRQEEEATQEQEAARQQLQLLQQRLDAALAAELRLSSQVAPKSHKPWNVPRQEVEIFSEIGRGAWGTVYKGKFQGQSVAVKCVHPKILDEHTIERLRREVQIMAQVRHPNLLRFIGAVLDSQVALQNPPLIVLELLDTNLRMAYQTKQLQGSSKIPIFRDIAYALHYLHELQEPIIHRDVSAPNVLLEALPSGMWRAKVSDFGSANLARLAQTMAEGAIIYAAPETFPRKRPLPQTTKIDVFSYGVLLCEVIMSQMPDPERFWIMLQRVEQQWPFMHKLIDSCTNENADERPTMAEVLDQLNTLPRPKH